MNLKELLENNEDWKALTLKEKRTQAAKLYYPLIRAELTPERRREIAMKGVEARRKKYGWKWNKEQKKKQVNKPFNV